MRRACDIGAVVFTILGVGFLALGFLNRTWPRAEATTDPGGVSYIRAVQSFGEAPAKTTFDVTFTIKNTSQRDVHVLGSESNCGRYACAFVKSGELPMTVPPGATRDLSVEIHATFPGDFVQEMNVFTDSPGQTKLPLTVMGKVVPGVGDAKKSS